MRHRYMGLGRRRGVEETESVCYSQPHRVTRKGREKGGYVTGSPSEHL